MEKVKISITNEANKAILEVITHQYKKDCPEAHKFVQSLGYAIEKIDGAFRVVNKVTNKSVWYRHYWNVDAISLSGGCVYFKLAGEMSKINFVNYLNTPFNDYRYNKNGYGKYVDTKSDAVRKYEVLRLAKHNAKVCRDEIISQDAKLKRAIEDYQNQTKYYKEQAEKHDKEIEELRKKYGLTK